MKNHDEIPKVLLGLVSPVADPTLEGLRCGKMRPDWALLLDQARRHKVASIVATRILEHDLLGILPSSARQQITSIREDAEKRSEMARQTARHYLPTLLKREIDVILLKGRALEEQIYGSPGMRRFADVDVLVREESLAAAEQILRSTGYQFRMGIASKIALAKRLHPNQPCLPEDLVRPIARRYSQHYVYVHPDPGLLTIELHWRLYSPDLLPVPPRETWDHVHPARVCGLDVLTLNTSLNLVYLATHALRVRLPLFRLLPLADVAWLLHRRGARMEPAVIWRMARRWKVEQMFEFALRAADKLFHTPNGQVLLNAQSRRRVPGWIVDRVATPDVLAGPSSDRAGTLRLRVGKKSLWALARFPVDCRLVRRPLYKIVRLLHLHLAFVRARIRQQWLECGQP